MRNIFKTVYCDECEHVMLAANHGDMERKLGYAKCKVNFTIKRKHISRSCEEKSYDYCSLRSCTFCFKFKEKA